MNKIVRPVLAALSGIGLTDSLPDLPINPSNPDSTSSKAQGGKDFRKSNKPCHDGIHWIALTEYSQISTHPAGFQSFFDD